MSWFHVSRAAHTLLCWPSEVLYTYLLRFLPARLCACVDQWDVQPMVQRIVEDLQHRGYLVWWDVERMKVSSIESCPDDHQKASQASRLADSERAGFCV